jgi:hypothetical protein
MSENFPTLWKRMDIQIHLTQRTPNIMNPKKYTPTHMIFKLSEVKTKENFYSSKRKVTCYKTISGFLSRKLEGQRDDLFNVMKKINPASQKILYLAKLSFRNEGEIKTFPDKQKPKFTTSPDLQEMLKRIL